MYNMLRILIITIIVLQQFGDTSRIKRSWEWPKETEGKENGNWFAEKTTVPPQPANNPCERIPREPRPNFKQPGRRISEAKCLEYIWETKDRADTVMREEECRKYRLEHPNENENEPSFAIGGRDTIPGEFPHMGAVGWKAVRGTWIFKCGSSVISSKYMLTAAHCSRSPPDDKIVSQDPKIVRIGDKSIIDFLPNDQFPLDIKISKIIKHPQYSPPKKYFDLALIELADKIYFTTYLMPACLWTKADTSAIDKATLTGWGVIETTNRQTSPELQAAVVDVLDSSLCDALLKPSCNRLWCGMHPDQICAGKLAGGVDACQGDSGGPLQVKIPLPASTNQSMHYVIGVTSFGIGCARKNLPGVYTRVSSFIDWIESIVWSDELENKTII